MSFFFFANVEAAWKIHETTENYFFYHSDDMHCFWLGFIHWPVCVASFASTLQSEWPLGSGNLMFAEEHVVQHSPFVCIGLRFLTEPKEIKNWHF